MGVQSLGIIPFPSPVLVGSGSGSKETFALNQDLSGKAWVSSVSHTFLPLRSNTRKQNFLQNARSLSLPGRFRSKSNRLRIKACELLPSFLPSLPPSRREQRARPGGSERCLTWKGKERKDSRCPKAGLNVGSGKGEGAATPRDKR